MNEDDDDGDDLPHDNPHQSSAREKSVARKIRARSFWRRRRPFPEPSLRGWWTDDYDDDYNDYDYDDDYRDNDDDYNDYDTGWSADDRGGGRSWFPDNPGWVSRREDKDKEDNVSDHDNDHDLSVADHDQVRPD